MKNLILIALVAVSSAFAQTEPEPQEVLSQTDTEPQEVLKRIQAEAATGDVTAFFEKSVTINGVTYAQPWEAVSWNNATDTVTVGDKTLTYGEVMQFVVAIAMKERAKQQQEPRQ